MAWIESHDTLGDHPKIYELSASLNVDKPTTIGLLHLLWHFTLKFAWRDGDLSKFSKEAVCASIGWDKDADMFFSSLQSHGWLDDMKIHDWMDYAGKIVKDRLYRESKSRRKTVQKVSKRRKTRLPNRTVPNLTIPKEIPPKVPQGTGEDFEEFWKLYPRKTGKGAAEKAWKGLKSDQPPLSILAKAISIQKQSNQWKKDAGQFIPYPATWLNQKRWLDEDKGNSEPQDLMSKVMERHR